MRILVVAALLALVAMTVVAESSDGTLGLREYVDRFLANSVELETAADSEASARDAFENAKISQQSNYNLGLLESELAYQEAQTLATENANVKLAFQYIFASTAAASTLQFAITSEQVAASVYARSEELSRKEYISARDTLVARMTYVQASANTRSAIAAHRASQKTLVRSIGGNMESLEIDLYDLSVPMPEIPALEWYMDRDLTVVKHKTNLPLFRDRRNFLLVSESFSPAELETIEQTIVDSERTLQQRIWLLHDNLEQLHSQFAAHVDAKEIAELDFEVKSIDLEQARYQYAIGDIYASDVAAAELGLAIAAEALASLERSRLLLVIDALVVSKVPISGWVADSWGR